MHLVVRQIWSPSTEPCLPRSPSQPSAGLEASGSPRRQATTHHRVLAILFSWTEFGAAKQMHVGHIHRGCRCREMTNYEWLRRRRCRAYGGDIAGVAPLLVGLTAGVAAGAVLECDEANDPVVTPAILPSLSRQNNHSPSSSGSPCRATTASQSPGTASVVGRFDVGLTRRGVTHNDAVRNRLQCLEPTAVWRWAVGCGYRRRGRGTQ